MKFLNLKSGFTLIEVVIVMSIFLFVIGSAITIFLSVLQNQRSTLNEQELISQVSYVQDYMSRALRMAKTETTENCLVDALGQDHQGYIYLLTKAGTSGIYNGIMFINQTDNDACTEIFLDTDGILKVVKNKGTPVALTSANLKINYIKFGIDGLAGTNSSGFIGVSGNDDPLLQPRVTLLLNVQTAGNSSSAPVTIQTTVSERNLNLPH